MLEIKAVSVLIDAIGIAFILCDGRCVVVSAPLLPFVIWHSGMAGRITLTGIALVLGGGMLSPACAMRAGLSEEDEITANATTMTAGDPLAGAFVVGSLMHTAIQKNMFAITGGKNYEKGESQELSYRFDSNDEFTGLTGFNDKLKTQVYYCKAKFQDPSAGNNLPGMSLDSVVAVGEDPGGFEVAGLKTLGIDVILNIDTGRLKGNEFQQPVLAASSPAFTMYKTGAAVSGTCYLILAHNHEIYYHTKMYKALGAYPTETQILGTTDLTWFASDGTVPPPADTLCGVCLKIKWSFPFPGVLPTLPPEMQQGTCATKRSGSDFSRNM